MNPKEVLDERYELVRRIGVGGMGSVWEARELPSGRHVAIKALHEHLMTETELVTRFLREAQAALEARFSGHIIEVYDVVQPAERPPYIVMEFLEGEDLEQILEREGRLEPRRAMDLIIQNYGQNL
jgi:serine/threonine-protein kinase